MSFEDLKSDIWKNGCVLQEICSKSTKHSIFWRASRKFARFWLIYSKNAENGMSFEIHLATITTGSLSFGLKNPWVFLDSWVFSALGFFENVKKKAWLNEWDLNR